MKISKASRKSSLANRPSDAAELRDLRQSLDRGTMEEAHAIADQYTIVLEPNARLGYRGTALEFPTVFVSGKTPNECIKKMRDALMVGVAVMLEAGESPPLPASDERRDQQINIRLTAEERALLESAAKRRGFRGVSDFVRSAALTQTRRSA